MVPEDAASYPVGDPMKRAVSLLSGGLDSFVAAGIARKSYRLSAITISYGQRHSREIEAARDIALFLGVEEHRVVECDLSWVASALTNADDSVSSSHLEEIPSTYVPGRNTIFISIALAYAETIGADAVVTGINCVDYSGYPDCRPAYLEAFQRLVSCGLRKTVEGGQLLLYTPLLYYSKQKIILEGIGLGLDLSLSWSCYEGGEYPCGVCPSCRIRAEGFKKAEIADPAMRRKKGC